MAEELFLGIDIGGTDTKIGIVNGAGSILEKRSIKTESKDGPGQLADRVYIECQTLANCMKSSLNDIKAAGIGAPGVIDVKNGVVIFSPNLQEWKNAPVAEMFNKRLNMICALENDANVAAWGEKWAGAGKSIAAKSMVMITLGTGIGGGVIINDDIWHGRDNVAGEIGHMIIEVNGVKCGCGGFGCVEAYASATAVARRFKEAANDGMDITAEDVYNKAAKGDELAAKIMRDTGAYLGVAIVNIMHILNPDVITIGGGMSAARTFLEPSILTEINKRAYKVAGERTKVVFAELGNDSGIIGAAGWARNILETSA